MRVNPSGKMKLFFCFVVAVQLVLWTRAAKAEIDTSKEDPSTALKNYIERPDKSFAWHIRGRVEVAAGKCLELIVTSQTWHDTVWKHQLFIYKPANVADTKHALLIIDGGDWSEDSDSNSDKLTSNDVPASLLKYAKIGEAANCIVAVLRQVPQQPIFDGRREDQIIALTFANFLSPANQTGHCSFRWSKQPSAEWMPLSKAPAANGDSTSSIS